MVKLNYDKIFLLILILAATLSFAFYYGPDAAAGEDNYFYSYAANLLATNGLNPLAQWGTAGLKYVVIAGTAFFYKMLGPSEFSSTIFSVLCFLGIIVCVYVIGSRLHSRRAGLIAALLFAVLPLAVSQTSSAGDDIPMTFLTTLSILSFILALQNGNGKKFYFISGFFGLSSFFASPEGLLILLPIFATLAYLTIKERNESRIFEIGLVFAGVLSAFLLFSLVAYSETGSLSYIVSAETTSYSASCLPNPGIPCYTPTLDEFNYYLATIFPYHFTTNLSELFSNKITSSTFLSLMMDPSTGSLDNDYDFAYYSYLAVLSLILLLLLKDKRGYFPVLWVALAFLYLSFGSTSVSHYVAMALMYPRYTLIFLPAMVLIIAFGLADLLAIADSRYRRYNSKRRSSARLPYSAKKYLLYFLVGLVIFLLASYSIVMIRDMNYAWYKTVYNVIAVANFIDTLPQNAVIFGSNSRVPVQQYTTYQYDIVDYEVNATNCAMVPSGTYVFVPYNASLQKTCGLKLLFPFSTVPAWLSPYSLYIPIIYNYPDYISLSVYLKT